MHLHVSQAQLTVQSQHKMDLRFCTLNTIPHY